MLEPVEISHCCSILVRSRLVLGNEIRMDVRLRLPGVVVRVVPAGPLDQVLDRAPHQPFAEQFLDLPLLLFLLIFLVGVLFIGLRAALWLPWARLFPGSLVGKALGARAASCVRRCRFAAAVGARRDVSKVLRRRFKTWSRRPRPSLSVASWEVSASARRGRVRSGAVHAPTRRAASSVRFESKQSGCAG